MMRKLKLFEKGERERIMSIEIKFDVTKLLEQDDQ